MPKKINDTELMDFPYYGYKSCLKDFKAAVLIASDLLEKKEIYFIFKNIYEVNNETMIKEDVFSTRNYGLSFANFNIIFENELCMILGELLSKSFIDFDNFSEWFMNNKNDKNELNRYIEGHKIKSEYAEKFLINDEMKKYHGWKSNFSDNRLAISHFDISKRIMKNECEVPFANITFWVSSVYSGRNASDEQISNVFKMMDKFNISCDVNDLNCLIARLTEIRDELNGL